MVVSVLASFPTLSRFYIYYSYQPPVDVFIVRFENSTIKWSEIFGENGSIAGISINNKDAHHGMNVEMEIVVTKPVTLRSQFEDYFVEKAPCSRGFLFRTSDFYLPENGGGGPAFPFDKLNEQLEMEITIYPKMKMSDFGLPRFFGDIDLRPFTKTFTVMP